MKAAAPTIIYENPLPQLRSRQAAFPNICELKDGTLLAAFVIGEAFESVDCASYISRSTDKGATWSTPQKMFDHSQFERTFCESCKVTPLPDGRVIALGYGYFRDDPELPVGNPETGGLLDDFVFYSVSEDGGLTWGELNEIKCSWGPHVEASAPLYVLKDGTWITPITGFPAWDGHMTGPMCGRALRSEDQGKTWSDEAVCMEFTEAVTCYEQRMCELESGALICIGWNENTATGERLNNHYTVSYDGGKTWSEPITTGVQGQASSVVAIGGEKLLAIHAIRRDTDEPGIYGYVVDFSEKKWNIVDKALLWAPAVPMIKDTKMAEIFSFLKFGQPSVTVLHDGSMVLTFWYAQEGQYKTVCAPVEF
ncbi:MAG: sialidase family protein [Eubacteriales bacterium]|nr:sialidase family protein [Eubacteriales bacterium]